MLLPEDPVSFSAVVAPNLTSAGKSCVLTVVWLREDVGAVVYGNACVKMLEDPIFRKDAQLKGCAELDFRNLNYSTIVTKMAVKKKTMFSQKKPVSNYEMEREHQNKVKYQSHVTLITCAYVSYDPHASTNAKKA